tara:strand:- start:1915 stop:2349 length:435 start_codon:yes stop_codon:yes gene_type:complete
MKLTKRGPLFVCAVAVFFLASCASSFGSEDEKLADKAVSLGYVAGALEGLIKFGNPPETMAGADLLKEATKQNPDLLKPLTDYVVMARREGAHSSVLLCNKDKTRGLAEDSGCTSARLDGKFWTDTPNAPCAFQLNLAVICKKH